MGKFFSFQGVANRIEYIQALGIATGLIVLMYLFSGASATDASYFFAMLFGVVGAWIGLAADVRRLHDRNATGWWVVLRFVPLINLIMLIYLLFAPSVRLDNKYSRSYYDGDVRRRSGTV